MPTVQVKRTMEITLTLSAEEAWILKGLVQNSIPGEDAAYTTWKRNIFNALPSFEELTVAHLQAK